MGLLIQVTIISGAFIFLAIGFEITKQVHAIQAAKQSQTNGEIKTHNHQWPNLKKMKALKEVK